MRLVIVESPFAGDVEKNIRYARACVRDSLLRGEAPIASHLLYTQDGILDDNIESERQHGIDAGLAWRAVAEASIVYTDLGISKGMEYGIAAAIKSGNPVEYRSIETWKEARRVVEGIERHHRNHLVIDTKEVYAKYNNMWVAAYDEKIVATSSDMDELFAKIDEQSIPRGECAVVYCTDDPVDTWTYRGF